MVKMFADRELIYDVDRVIDKGKIHWFDDDFVVIDEYVLKDAIESDEELPRWVWTYLVKIRDNWTCVKCGRHEPWEGQGRQPLCANHIVYIKNYQELGKHVMSNGETLCWSCHSKKHCNMRGNHNKHYRSTKRWRNVSEQEKKIIMLEEDRKSIIDKP